MDNQVEREEDKSGRIEDFPNVRVLNVTNYDQYALGAPTGCEGASLLQALQFKGKLTNMDLVSFLREIPQTTNGSPETGFVGSPFEENDWTYTAIYPGPLAKWGQTYGEVSDISGCSVNELLDQVGKGNPVIAWVSIDFEPLRWAEWSFGRAANNNHAVTLDGFDRTTQQVHVSDPISGTYWLLLTKFQAIYDERKFAVVVRS